MTDISVPLKDSIEYRIAIQIARNRHGPGVDMGGSHNPRPSEWALARDIVEQVRREAK